MEGLREQYKSQIAIPTDLPMKGKGKTMTRTAVMTSWDLGCKTCNCFATCLDCGVRHNYNPVSLTANSRTHYSIELSWQKE